MKNLLKCFFVVAAILMFGACTIHKPAEPIRTVTVRGIGSVTEEPDAASLELSVNTSGWIAKQAASDNALITSKVIEAIKESGVGTNDISTSGYLINQEKSWVNGRQINGKYIVTNSIKVVVNNTAILGDIIDNAVKAGANGIDSLTFLLLDKASAVRQARTAAVQQAQDTASLLAGSSGCILGQVMKIDEISSGENSAVRYLKTSAEEVSTSEIIQKGKINVHAQVEITYALQ